MEVIALTADEFIKMMEQNKNDIPKMEEDINRFMKLVKNNKKVFNGRLIELGLAPTELIKDDSFYRQVLRDAVNMMTSEDMKINGEINNWSCGQMGSIWCDMTCKKYNIPDLRGIRLCYYSKAFPKGMNMKDCEYKLLIIVSDKDSN